MVSTLAGSGTLGFEDGPASAAEFNSLAGVGLDPACNLYIADLGNDRIRLLANGNVSTVAGNGTYAYQDGAAGASEVAWPEAVAIDGQGNVFVADHGNNRIRLISDGVVTTFAGSGDAGFMNGPASSAQFSSPNGVAVDQAGNVYVADSVNNSIRLIANGLVTTLAGDGTQGFMDGPVDTAEFADPNGVAVDGNGVVYVADRGNGSIRQIANGLVTTVAGTGTQGFLDGPASSAEFSDPAQIAIDGAGNIYVADAFNNRIRRISQGLVTTYAGTGDAGFQDGPAASADFNMPEGIAVDGAGNVFVADSFNSRLRLITP